MRTLPTVGERVRIKENALVMVGHTGRVVSTLGGLVLVEPDDSEYATLAFELGELDRA